MARIGFLAKIKELIQKEGLVARTNASRKWLGGKIRELKINVGARYGLVNLSKNSQPVGRGIISTGKMYFFFYDPKTKEKLPYYDTFPLVIPLDYMPPSKSATKRDPGFIGLNLHYLHPKYRLRILDELYSITNNKKFDETTKARLTYRALMNNIGILNSGAKSCLKWYLFKQVQSRMLQINADEWDIAALLPFESFEKKTKTKVWADSRRNM